MNPITVYTVSLQFASYFFFFLFLAGIKNILRDSVQLLSNSFSTVCAAASKHSFYYGTHFSLPQVWFVEKDSFHDQISFRLKTFTYSFYFHE